MSSGFESTEELVDRAVRLMKEQDHAAALPLLSRIVAFEPELAYPYLLWVLCHIKLGRHERALELADAGLAKDLAPADMNVQKAMAYRALERYDEAMLAAQAALDIDPEFADAQHVLIELSADLHRPELVIEHAREYLRRFGKEPEVLALLGHAYADRKDYRRADRAFRDAALLEPELVDHHVNVLMNALTMNDAAGYDRYLDRLEASDPELADAAASAVDAIIDAIHDDS
jgi:tetratricopeptide (TPR) repeat protein